MKKFTIKEFNATYPNDDACLADLFQKRYGNLKKCPSCKFKTKFHKVSGRKCYACQSCGYQLHPLADTIFHKSDTPLKLWFYAIFLFANSKNGVAAKELQRQIGVTYKTAWRMAKQIRLLFSKTGNGKLSNIVEADETYVGARMKRGTKRGRGSKHKTAVFGVVERNGEIRAYTVPDTSRASILPIIKANVEDGARIMTDEYAVYGKVRSMGYYHRKVNHTKKQYARGITHTNTIEGFWSQLKRSIHGTHHSVSRKYLQNYVDEFAYRYNHRNDETSSFSSMISEVVTLA